MTAHPRNLNAPVLEAQTFATRRTARASHGAALADLAADAAGGHLGQRWTIARVEATVRHWFFESASNARFLDALAVVGNKGSTWTDGDAVTLALTITDGTTVANALVDGIPDGLRGDRDLAPAPIASYAARHRSFTVHRWTLDLDTIRGVLGASTRWRLTLTVTCDATCYLESFQVTELPRFVVDSADTYGQPPQDYLPRAPVVDGAAGLQRVGATLEAAYDGSLRTYHAAGRDEGAPLSTTSATYAVLSGDSEPGGAAVQYVTRPRKMKGTASARVRFRCRYRITGGGGAATGGLRLTTGVSTYDLALTDTSGAWADSGVEAARLKTDGTDSLDSLSWKGKTSAGTLEISAITVWDYPD